MLNLRQGFTLIELLIVMAILGVMMAIIVVSGGMVTATQVAMASKDTLRLMRYARNMALQTQQPITLSFAPGVITLETPFDTETTPQTTPTDSTPETASLSDNASEASSSKGNFLQAGDIEAVGLVKYYENVGFEFVAFNDSITMGRTADKSRADFQRRVAGEADEEAGERLRQKAETFSITIRANGTTRPFTVRVYDQDAADDAGNFLTFDFLCTGAIGEKAP